MLGLEDTVVPGSDEADLMASREGELWDNRYLIGHTLGRGGMSVVRFATDTVLGREVALKCLPPARGGTSQELFTREGRTTARLQSEHTVRIYDIGVCPRGSPYLCLELLHGTDLASLLRARGPLCLEDVLLFILQSCEALAEAHALGIVHRDLKPSNLFLTRRIDGSALIKVIDFGIATHFGRRDEPGMVIGSPGYMAPEQLMGSEHIGVQADIWALGLILCELATGRMPFESTDRLWWLAGRQPPRPMSLLAPGLPIALDAVLARCLYPDPSARYASVAEFSEALADADPDSSPQSAERISRITNLVRESQRPVTLAQGSFVGSTGPTSTISGARSAQEGTGECRPLDGSAASPGDAALTVREGSQTVRQGQPGNQYEEQRSSVPEGNPANTAVASATRARNA